ncbi:MAG: glycosyltransferase family 2 protein [Lachnospiraceae bacterium]|nr:glycosyltransferase family 2 protein [Lachnospiraceae bacterium]
MNENKYIVDVLIPTYKPGSEFQKLLLGIMSQNYPIRNILVVNTEKKYWNPVFEQICPTLLVEHISMDEFNHGGTRGAMAASSDADILVFMTQDAIPADNCTIERMVSTFALNRVRAAYARQLPAPGCRLIERYTRNYNYPPSADIKDKDDLPTLGIKTFFCSNVCAAYDRRTYEKLGGFPAHTIFGEDMIYASKLVQQGYAIAYAAESMVIHSHNYNCRQQFRRNFDIGVTHAQFPEVFGKYPSEGEGIQMVKKTAAYVCTKRKPWLLVPLFFQSASKYIGYFLGKHYQILPNYLVQICTMNKNYWK